jgi:hypothetical protein
MTIAYLDTVGGIAGDMTMAAFVSAGFPLEALQEGLQALGVEGFELQASHVSRSAIDAVHCDVVITQELQMHRHLSDILGIIEKSALSPRVKERASSIFRVLAEAEAVIHRTTPEKVHFHEVGALDSIVDIVGAALCLEHFGIERVYSSPVRLGNGGLITTQHGTMPTPAPATLEILKGYPTALTSVPHELTTPTGAAIIKALSSGTLDEERITVTAIGYGAGTKEFPEIPNFLRVIIGTLELPLDRDDVVVVETNIDDMNPQAYPFIIDKLLAAGAHDAYLVPIVMKKGRPGILLSVMTPHSRLEAVTALLYRETTTIGLRVHSIGRLKLPRKQVEVNTSFGLVRAKAVERDGREIITAEYEECRRIAAETQLPLLEVMRRLGEEIR